MDWRHDDWRPTTWPTSRIPRTDRLLHEGSDDDAEDLTATRGRGQRRVGQERGNKAANQPDSLPSPPSRSFPSLPQRLVSSVDGANEVGSTVPWSDQGGLMTKRRTRSSLSAGQEANESIDHEAAKTLSMLSSAAILHSGGKANGKEKKQVNIGQSLSAAGKGGVGRVVGKEPQDGLAAKEEAATKRGRERREQLPQPPVDPVFPSPPLPSSLAQPPSDAVRAAPPSTWNASSMAAAAANSMQHTWASCS